MKGCFFLGAEHEPRFIIKDMSFDELRPDDILVRVKACGVCGTDVHIYKGEKGSAEVTPPVVLGHEFAGIVVKVGQNVTKIKPGDHVTVDPNMYCGNCVPCRMGKKQNCENLYALGVNTNGGFAEFCICPQNQAFIVNPDIDFDEAAMTEPLACVLHGIDQLHIQPGQNVLVIGGGTIGLLMAQMVKITGASSVILSEPIKSRREIGLEIGVDAVIDPVQEDLTDRLEIITGRKGADVVIECVGSKRTSEQAFQAAAAGATILLFGVPSPEAVAELPLFDVYKKELKIVGSMINPDTHQRAIRLLNNHRIEIKKLITHIYDLQQVENAVHMQMSSESIKVMVHP